MPSNDDHEFSDSDGDNGFSEDMEPIRKSCLLTGTNPGDLASSPFPAGTADYSGRATTTTLPSESDADDGADDDLESGRCIQRRFSVLTDIEEPLTLNFLCSIPPVGAQEDNFQDDFDTLRAIQQRLAAYNTDVQKENTKNVLHISEQGGVTNIASEKEISNEFFLQNSNALGGFSDFTGKSSSSTEPSDFTGWHKSGFLKSAEAFVEAIKKNRSCQKLIRSKLLRIEEKFEELRKIKERVKILKDFQAGCKKRTGRALSQKKDPRVQLIPVPKLRPNAKIDEKNPCPMYYGPAENSQVSNYRAALENFPVFLSRDNWSKEEKENLAKGVKQQFQEMLLERSLDLDNSLQDLDSIVALIRDVDLTPENMRMFLPMVNWDQLASMYVRGRSGAECQARWLNCGDPLINQNSWSAIEDKNLLYIVQQKGLSNWIDIAVSLGTNRTPFQCLARYQRSLNASILKKDWTEEEDIQLRAAVDAFGDGNWQAVASALEGRTGTQCSNRWTKILHPTRQKVGRWTADEDKRLKVSVRLFGPKTWNKIAEFVPGRTQVQCRERWVNSLDPSLNWNEWTEEEDLKLKAAIEEHGRRWSKVAACVPRRTDNQCWRRWKVLFPQEVPIHRAARKILKTALISNFVDRESERPALGPNDFVTQPGITRISETKNANPSGKRKTRSSRRGESYGTDVPAGDLGSEEVQRLTNTTEAEDLISDSIQKKKRKRPPPRKTASKTSTRAS